MREASHEKGKKYQRTVKYWLSNNSLLGLSPELYGDAYDISNKATEIGGHYFDFSLKLSKNDDIKCILYAECKYRSEKTGNINSDFKKFLNKIYSVILENKKESKYSEFIFISNIPPDNWRKILNKEGQYIKSVLGLSEVDNDSICQMNIRFHVLVLSMRLIGV